MVSILLIDDDVELTSMLQEYLEMEGYQVKAVHNGEIGATEALSGKYHLAVLDVMMPVVNGIEALRRIRMKSNMPVIMLTARGDDMDRIIGLELGADDYVPKPSTPRELAARIRAVLRRMENAAPAPEQEQTQLLEAGALKLWLNKRKAEWRGETLELTSCEFSLLTVLLQNVGKAVSKDKLSEQGLGRPLARFDRSIDVHMSSIRQKLGETTDGRSYIQTVYRQGYMYIQEA